MDITHSLYPFFVHRLDVGPIRLASIAHAFNYKIAVLRDGVKSAARIGHSQRAAQQILEDVDIPWGHQIAVMFQVVCALALEVPGVLLELRLLNGVSPNVVPVCEPWGHVDHCNEGCECLSSDRTGAYAHDLSLASCDVLPVSGESPDAVSPALTRVPNVQGVNSVWDGGSEHSGAGRPGSVPFVSHRPLGRVRVVADGTVGGV